MSGPLGPTAIDRRRASVPAARAGDRLGLVLVLVDHVLEGLVRGGGLDGRSAVQWNLCAWTDAGPWVNGGSVLYPFRAVPAGRRALAVSPGRGGSRSVGAAG